MSGSQVWRETLGPITILTLNRLEKRNALSRALVAELSDALDVLAADPSHRVLILTGAGHVFCAGMDLTEACEATTTTEAEQRAVDETQAIGHLIQQLHTFSRPTIAALNGDAIAGGAGLASACDFVIATEGTRIGYPEVKRGLVASIVMHDLVRQVGDRRARDLLLSGRLLDIHAAERWGLVNLIVPADRCREEALVLARELLSSAPKAVATTKQLLDEASRRPTDLRGPAAISAAVRVSEEAREGMSAFLEKREPAWTKP